MSLQPSNRNQFVWEVHDFSTRSQKPKISFYSPLFHSTNLYETEWKMRLGVNVPEKNNSISFYIKRCSSASDTGPNDLFLQMDVCIIDVTKKECFAHYMKCNFRKGRRRGFSHFVERKIIIENRNSLLQQDNLTVQCCIWKCPLDQIQPRITLYSAKIKVEHPSFLWTLGWFREWEFYVKRNIFVLSDITLNGFELYGMLEKELNEQGQSRDVLCLYIAPMAANAKHILIAGTIAVLDYFHRCRIAITGQHFFEAGSNLAWRFARICKSDLADPSKHILDLNTLRMKCEFTVADRKRAVCTRERLTPLINVLCNDKKTLSTDIACFVTGAAFPDIQLKLGNEMFPAHRMILSARSPVFHEVLTKAEYKRNSRRTLPIRGSESDSDVQQKRNRHRTLPLYDTESDSDIVQKNVAPNSSHWTSPLDDSGSDSDVAQKKVAQKSSRRTLPTDNSESDSDIFPTKVAKKGHRTLVDYESDNIKLVPDDSDNSSKSSNESQSDSVRIETGDKINASCAMSRDSSESESENIHKDTYKSPRTVLQCGSVETQPESDDIEESSTHEIPRTSPLDDSVLQCDGGKTESESDDVLESSTDKSPRTSPLDDSVLQCDGGKTESESDDDVQESSTDKIPRTSPLDDSVLQCDGGKTESESDDDVLESSNDITISVKNDVYIAEISRMNRHTLEQMIMCMYTDAVSDMDLRSAVALFHAGVKYQFQLLRDKCEFLLICAINIKTVYYLLQTADSVPMLNLKDAVLNFMEKNFESILLSDEWQDFLDTHKELGTNTLRFLRDRKNNPV